MHQNEELCGWLLGCCLAVARVLVVVPRAVARLPEVVARVLLCGC